MNRPVPNRTEMSPKLEAVLARLAQRLGPITKTRAVKLPYLVDVVAQHALGHPIAGGTYQTWDYGVVTREVFSFMTYTDGDEYLAVEPHPYSEGGRSIRSCGGLPTELSAREIDIIDSVAEAFGLIDAGRLGALTKALNTHLHADAWGSNHEPELGEDAYARLSQGWQAFSERLPFLDFSDRSKWGEPLEDPVAHLDEALGA